MTKICMVVEIDLKTTTDGNFAIRVSVWNMLNSQNPLIYFPEPTRHKTHWSDFLVVGRDRCISCSDINVTTQPYFKWGIDLAQGHWSCKIEGTKWRTQKRFDRFLPPSSGVFCKELSERPRSVGVLECPSGWPLKLPLKPSFGTRGLLMCKTLKKKVLLV